MFKYFSIFFFLILITNTNANNREKIINNLKNTENLNFEFEQNINGKIENGNCIIEYPKKIFCEYLNNNNKVLVSNGKSLVIKTIASYYRYPQKKIHALVIPKGKYIDLDDFSLNASSEEMVGLIKGINTVVKKLGISTEIGKGYRALTNISEHGGQEVSHMHFHLFGGERVGKMVE